MFVIITNVGSVALKIVCSRTPLAWALIEELSLQSQINPHIRLEIAPSPIKKQRKIAFHTRRDSRAAK